MKFRQLSSDGDWTFGKGIGNYVIENDAVGLNVKTRLLSWVGDCFFDLGAGIDWVNRLGSKSQRAILELDLRTLILQTEGVTTVKNFSTQLVGRDFKATYDVETIYSQSYTDSIERVL
jgi:hypothetical protein